MATIDQWLRPDDQRRIAATIRDAEAASTGKIRVHLERHLRGDALLRARSLFHALHLHRTPARNAVLLYVAVADRRFAVVGDQGIHGAAGDALWDAASERMREGFDDGSTRRALGDGLCAGIALVGQVLAEHFPRRAGVESEPRDDLEIAAPAH